MSNSNERQNVWLEKAMVASYESTELDLGKNVQSFVHFKILGH